jgi:hypothetical protein
MVEQKNIWKFNDEEWKVHVEDESIIKKVQEKFNLGKPLTIYYGYGSFQEETAWDLIVPNDLINKVKKYIKDNS